MKHTSILLLVLVLLSCAIASAEQVAVKCTVEDLGIVVTWTPEAAIADKVNNTMVSWFVNNPQAAQSASYRAGVNSCVLAVQLNDGDRLSVRVTVAYREGRAMKFAQGEGSADGPTNDIALTANATVLMENTPRLADIRVEGGAADRIRLYDYDRRRLIADIPGNITEFPLTDLEAGTRYTLALLPVKDDDGKVLRGMLTVLAAFVTALDKEWKPVNRGFRLNGENPLPDLDYTLQQVYSFEDKSGDLLFIFPTRDLGMCMGRFNARNKMWEVLSTSGWTKAHDAIARPVYDGLFRIRDMVFFSDRSNNVHAVTDCSTASNQRVLDIHGNFHDMRYDGNDWDQWIGGAEYGRKRTRTLFNSWGGTGMGTAFDVDEDGIGLQLHAYYTFNSNKHLIANRLETQAKGNLWQLWGKEGWKEHKDFSHEFVVGDKADGKDYQYPRVLALGKGKWLVLFQHVANNNEIWTALRYDDKKMTWERATAKGWDNDGDFLPVTDLKLTPRTNSLIRDGKGRVWLYGIAGGKLIRQEFDEKRCIFGTAEEIGDITAPPRSYFRPYLLAQAPDGDITAAFSRNGYDVYLTGKGAIHVSPEPTAVIGLTYFKGKPYVFIREDGNLIALKESPILGELSHEPPPYYTPQPHPMPSDRLKLVDVWTNIASHPDNNARPPYGPGESGRLGCAVDGTLYSPHYCVCSVTVFPPQDSREKAVYWGGFWDFFSFPMAVAVSSSRSKVYIADRVTNGGGGGLIGGSIQIWDMSLSGRCVVKKPGLSTPGIKEDYEPERISGFYWLADLAVDDEAGILYALSSLDSSVVVFDIKGEKPVRKSSFGNEHLVFPRAIEIGPDGLLYVLDGRAHRVCVFTPEGVLRRKWGECGRKAGSMLYPWDIAIDPVTCNLFVSDPMNGRISCYTPEGTLLYDWTEFERTEQVNPRGQTSNSNSDATGLTCDSLGHLYVGVGREIIKYRILESAEKK